MATIINGIRVNRVFKDIPLSYDYAGFGTDLVTYISYYDGSNWKSIDEELKGHSPNDEALKSILSNHFDFSENQKASPQSATKSKSTSKKNNQSSSKAEDVLDANNATQNSTSSGNSAKESLVASLPEEEHNFRYTREQTLAPRGRVSRLKANLEAIKLAKQLSQENRFATTEEKTILSRFNGFGADKEVFNDSYESYRSLAPEAQEYYSHYMSWENEYGKWHDEFKKLLTQSEWTACAASTLNAHYTNEYISHSLWDIAQHLGFQGGTVMDPGMGVGNLFGSIPQSLENKVNLVGVELDEITAQIAYHLYPQAEIQQGGFEECEIRDSSVDLVIANVPFGETGPASQIGTKLNLHNFFIAESMNKLKPGGLCVCITSASTLENNPEQRTAISQKAELLGALRLPKNAFKSNANTEVVTDILVFRKPNHIKVAHHTFSNKLPVELSPEGQISEVITEEGKDTTKVYDKTLVNEYFWKHPDQVLGIHSLKGKMYGRSQGGQYTVQLPDDSPPLDELLSNATKRLPQNIPNSSWKKQSLSLGDDESTEEAIGAVIVSKEKIGAFIEANNQIQQVVADKKGNVVKNILSPPPWIRDPDYKFPQGFKQKSADSLIHDFIKVKLSLSTLIQKDLLEETTDQESKANRPSTQSGLRSLCQFVGPF